MAPNEPQPPGLAPAPEPSAHVAVSQPHLATPEDHQAYESLLAALRKDLQLDPATDLLAGTPAALLHLGIARGVGTLTFTASTGSGVTTIAHGLASVPTAVVVTALSAPAFGEVPICDVLAVTATTFGVNGQTTTSWTGTVAFSWVAVI